MSRKRSGFSLVELLVAFTILAVLFALTSLTAVKFVGGAEDTRPRAEIGELGLAVEAFKARYKVTHLPSRIRLREHTGGYTPPADPLDKDSITFLRQLWPQLGSAVDWDGNPHTSGGVWDLQGDQCLVFFLGGIPAANGAATTGFSTNPQDPSWHVTRPDAAVAPPFFEFKGSRLARLHGDPFPSYLDPYGRADGNGMASAASPAYRPYAYFSSGKAGNDYTRYGDGATSDCRLLGVSPHREPASATSPTTFHNRNGFQILCAGPDRQFGPGGLGSPAAGRDDLTNFHESR